MTTKRLWLGLALVMGISFAVLIFFGTDIYRQAPPIPKAVLSASGDTLFTGQEIKDGQNVWQSIGGQTVGSIWGHGATERSTSIFRIFSTSLRKPLNLISPACIILSIILLV